MTALEATAEHEWCRRCGGANVSWAAPSPLWNLVMRDGSIDGVALFADMVCIGCFADLARQSGVTGRWRLTVTPDPPGLVTVSPTGRVWNPQTWLWDVPA